MFKSNFIEFMTMQKLAAYFTQCLPDENDQCVIELEADTEGKAIPSGQIGAYSRGSGEGH